MSQLVVAVWAADDGAARQLLPCTTSLRADDDLVIAGAPAGVELSRVADEVITAPDQLTFVNDVLASGQGHVAIAIDPVIVPKGWADRAREWLDDDMRVASVSFFSNAPGPTCFPWRDEPGAHHVEHMDDVSITARLRAADALGGRVRISWAAGPLVILGAAAIDAIGGLEPPPGGDAAEAVVDWCARGRQRGFTDVLDPATFVSWPTDLAARREPFGNETSWLATRHPQLVDVAAHERARAEAPFALAHAAARGRVLGLRVVVDGRCLGPLEMGTQVQTLHVIGALADHRDVHRVGVVLESDVPPYAKAVLDRPNIDVTTGGAVAELGAADIVHRPYQPDHHFDADRWSATGARLVVTVQDLIAYEVSSYHRLPTDWAAYRAGLRHGIELADGVIVISEDVRERALEASLPIENDRLFVVPNGTDHLHGDESTTMPPALLERSLGAAELLVCLGANYSHKLRDLAVRTVDELARRGRDVVLVMAGAAVPTGSSRVAEAEVLHAMAPSTRQRVLVLPDVASGERSWLLRHASVVLYPSASEGFGLVPFEAARFGTPTVAVAFGPLREMLGAVPVFAAGWDPRSFADAAERLLHDPALARDQVAAVLAAGTPYTWASTADGLVAAYHSVVRRPRRQQP